MDRLTLLKIAPKANAKFIDAFLKEWHYACKRYGLTTVTAQAGFIAQVCHETQGFQRFEENGNYSAPRLMQVWPHRFRNMARAKQFAHNPQALFNEVYANRMGNGSPSSGDGYNYRGSGLLQHTGKAEYERIQRETGYVPMDLRNPQNAKQMLAAAGTYCISRNVIQDFIAGDVDAATVKINGGALGLDDRKVLYRRAREALAGAKPKMERTTVERRDAAQAQAVAATGGAAATGTATATVTTNQDVAPQEMKTTAIWIGGLALCLVLGVVVAFKIRAAQKEQAALDAEQGAR
jgi:putative chitinase